MSEETTPQEAWRNGWIDLATYWRAIGRHDLLRFVSKHCVTCRCENREPPAANRGSDY